MKKNKIIDWVKKHKGLIIGTTISAGLGSIYLYYKKVYYPKALKTEGSDIWWNNASIDDLNNYRDKVHDSFRTTNNITEHDKAYWLLNRIDNKIQEIKWGNEPRVYNIPHSEHGWYLPEKD